MPAAGGENARVGEPGARADLGGWGLGPGHAPPPQFPGIPLSHSRGRSCDRSENRERRSVPYAAASSHGHGRGRGPARVCQGHLRADRRRWGGHSAWSVYPGANRNRGATCFTGEWTGVRPVRVPGERLPSAAGGQARRARVLPVPCGRGRRLWVYCLPASRRGSARDCELQFPEFPAARIPAGLCQQGALGASTFLRAWAPVDCLACDDTRGCRLSIMLLECLSL